MLDRLVFIIGSPRSGSTLLMRMLSSHSRIYSRPEPHLLTPLAHLGYFDNVDRAPFDHLQAAGALREFVADLPGGEQDYVDALRAYLEVMYGRMLSVQDKPVFLDKTPAYALILPFLARVLPDAGYVVLTRHPCSIWDSYAESFFDGDYGAALSFNPILERYVPAIAAFLRERPVPMVHLRYEDLVTGPERQLARIYEHLGLPDEPETVHYGRVRPAAKGGLGDPIGVGRHDRPVTASLQKWVRSAAADPERERILREIADRLDERDLAAWGYDKATLFDPLGAANVSEARNALARRRRARRFDRYRLQRRLLVLLRRDIHRSRRGALLRRVRFACDVLLRGGGGTGWTEEAARRYGRRARALEE